MDSTITVSGAVIGPIWDPACRGDCYKLITETMPRGGPRNLRNLLNEAINRNRGDFRERPRLAEITLTLNRPSGARSRKVTTLHLDKPSRAYEDLIDFEAEGILDQEW